jgi:5-methylcytosine-specific restriction endonuclease McrA
MHCGSSFSVETTLKSRLGRQRRCQACEHSYKLEWKRKKRGPRKVTLACPKGHPFPENRRLGRYDCVVCHRERASARAREKGVPERGLICKYGHPLVPANRKGGRSNGHCLTCHRLRENGIRNKRAIKYASALLHDPCSYCGNSPAVEIDHINPVARGGSKEWDNLTGACARCNRQKHARPLLVFLCERVLVGLQ